MGMDKGLTQLLTFYFISKDINKRAVLPLFTIALTAAALAPTVQEAQRPWPRVWGSCQNWCGGRGDQETPQCCQAVMPSGPRADVYTHDARSTAGHSHRLTQKLSLIFQRGKPRPKEAMGLSQSCLAICSQTAPESRSRAPSLHGASGRMPQGHTLPRPPSGIRFRRGPEKSGHETQRPSSARQNLPGLGQKRSSPGTVPVAPDPLRKGSALPAGPRRQ